MTPLTTLEFYGLNHVETQVKEPEGDDREKSTINWYHCSWVTLGELL